MLSRYLGVALAMVASSFFEVSDAQAQGSPALGMVVSARSGQVGTTPAAPGLTVFSGDRLVTSNDSGLIIQAGKFLFSFHDNTVATLILQPGGIALDVESGSVSFSSSNPDPGLSIFVSDVRIRPMDLQALAGDVTVADPCAVTITSYVGRLEVQRKNEREELYQRGIRVTPEFPIEPLRPGANPGDRAIHQGHTHGVCKLPPGSAAKGAWRTWLDPALAANATAVVVLIYRNSVSPH